MADETWTPVGLPRVLTQLLRCIRKPARNRPALQAEMWPMSRLLLGTKGLKRFRLCLCKSLKRELSEALLTAVRLKKKAEGKGAFLPWPSVVVAQSCVWRPCPTRTVRADRSQNLSSEVFCHHRKSHLEKKKTNVKQGWVGELLLFPRWAVFLVFSWEKSGWACECVCVCAGPRMGPGTSQQGNFQGADSVLSLVTSKRVSDGKQCQLVVAAPPCTSPALRECSDRRSS